MAFIFFYFYMNLNTLYCIYVSFQTQKQNKLQIVKIQLL